MLVLCKEKIFSSKDTLKHLIDRNNTLRMSIASVLLNISRPLLKKLEIAFKPGLSTVQWTSKHLNSYFENVSGVS